MNPDIPTFCTFTDEVFNILWTAGFNSGLKVGSELHEGLIESQEQVKARATELLNKNADEIVELLRLRRQMLRDEELPKIQPCPACRGTGAVMKHGDQDDKR